jgi:hypothetical protein
VIEEKYLKVSKYCEGQNVGTSPSPVAAARNFVRQSSDDVDHLSWGPENTKSSREEEEEEKAISLLAERNRNGRLGTCTIGKWVLPASLLI